MSTTHRLCAECSTDLTDSGSPSRRYCSDRCRERAKKRRARQRTTDTQITDLKRRLNESQRREARLDARLAATRERLDAERAKRAREAVKSRKSERYAERATMSRLRTLLDTRNRLQAVTADLEAGSDDRTDNTDLQVAAQQIVDLQKRLALVTDQYNDLSGQYSALRDRYAALVSDYNQAADRLNDAARDRHRFRPVLEAWDTLAGRLARSAKTAELSADDREIVRMWAQWQAGRERRRKANG